MSAPFNFNHDGPVKVNQTDFDIYKSLFRDKQPNFDALFYYWFDESHLDGTRRLAIRDLCRQAFDSTKARHSYYRVDMGFGRLVNLLGWNDPKESSAKHKALFYRPKLLNELVEEFLHAFQHGYVADHRNVDEFLQYLIPLVNKSTAQQLFTCHSRWHYPYPDKYIESHTRNLLEDIINENYPEWLRKELWENIIKKYCESEITALKNANPPAEPTTLSHIRFHHDKEVSVLALYTVSDFIGGCNIYVGKKSFTLITEIVKFFENNLPANIAYIYHGFQMVKLAPYFTDNATTFSYVRRHILMDTDKNLDGDFCDWPRFLYWARGLTSYAHPDDTELLAEIDRCLTIVTATAK